MDAREERVARNEALFRTVNERIEGMSQAFGDITGTFAIVCECGDESCIEQITLPAAEYERLRSDPSLFIVKPGHEEPDVETIVERGDGYDVVTKATAAAIDYADDADERS